MANTDLTALEGPDDWVSLFLDGGGDDMLTDLQVCAQQFAQFSVKLVPYTILKLSWPCSFPIFLRSLTCL